ncbi:MAG: GTPase [Thermoprotei archaeon]
MLLANWRLVKEFLESIDVALEVVDVRDPLTTRSRKFEKLCNDLGIQYLVVLNKSDLVPPNIVRAWVKYFKEVENVRAVPISAQKRRGTLRLRKIVKRLNDKKPLIVGVFGIPKVGKSTLINTWAGRHATRTSPYPGTPGYTKKAQLFNVGSGVYLLDTPGIIPVEEDDVEITIRMNPIDSVRNPVATAVGLIKKIVTHNPGAFREAYGIGSTDPDLILRELALRRGWIYKSDKEPVITESAKLIIRDYLDGKIRFYVLPPKTLPRKPI